LKNPKIFFFDEATSSLDSSTEKEIQKNLENISRNKTTLIIAHRLSTAANADTIIVLDNGVIVEQGTHNNLLSKKGKYFEMWEKQKLN
jgi:ABC-type transport system involved in Fe-S cluster assembly fused permease/ATPase subunit